VQVQEPEPFQHIPIGDMECTLCHDPASMNSGTWSFTILLPGGHAERVATFPHVKHAPLGCTTCHGRPPQPVQEDFTCAWTCHTPHLQAAEIDCRVCHQPPPQWAHEYGAVHQGCSGSLCHSLPIEEILPWRRPLCMVCHQDLEAYIPEVPPPGEAADTLPLDTLPGTNPPTGHGGR
jgi:hypothetical protein